MLPAFPAPRIAISLLFLLNGFLVGSWSARIPEFKERMGIDESEIGLVILVFGLGSLTIMPLNGWLISRLGTFWMMMPQAVAICFFFMVLTAAPDLVWALIVIFFAGGLIGGMDVAMNSNAVIVERNMARAIMSSCHGFWSLGAGLGSLAGGFLVPELGLWGHAFTVTTLSLMLVTFAWPMAHKDEGQTAEQKASAKTNSVFRSLLPWLIGLMALGSMFPEGAVVDWANLYLREEKGAGPFIASMAFAGFAFTMAVLRFAGDSVRMRFGALKTFKVSAYIAAVGLALAVVSPWLWGTLLGFAIAGIGIANTVPICFSAAGNLKGYPPGAAIALVTVLGYSGLLVVPPLIGFVAQLIGFSPVFLTLAGVLVLVSFGSYLLADADLPDEEPLET